MQYILTEEERAALVDKKELDNAKRAIIEMQSMIVLPGRCIHSKGGPEYCDGCPLSAIGGGEAEIRPSYELSKIMCTHIRNYSK